MYNGMKQNNNYFVDYYSKGKREKMLKNVKTRFTNRVDNYVKYRPTYPKQAIKYLTDIGLSNESDIADIGSGTGILSRLLIGDVNCLYGIEPNNEMRNAAEKDLGGFNKFISINGSAEDTTLDKESVDFITVAQAFHWFDRNKSLLEFKRILKKSGKFILIWNNRINTTPFLKGYEQLLLEYGTDYKEINHKNIADREIESVFTKDFKKVSFDNFQELDLAGLKGRTFSCSYTPAPDETGYYQLNKGIKDLFYKFNKDGKILFNYKTDIYTGSIK